MTKPRFFFWVLATTAISCGGNVAATPEPAADTGGIAVVDAASDASVPSDVFVPATEAGILCGMTTCDPVKQECCAGLSGAKCVDKGGCGGGAPISCSSPEHCPPGEVCCAEREGTGGKIACTKTCSGFVICKEDGDCTPPDTCRLGLGGYKSCRGGPPDGGFRPDAPRDTPPMPMDVTPG